ncbi:MAG: TonB-dependent receptor [Flavobacteriaceae bacterium]|nr:MAG: TonB-dependent receptor [Flavobacteriaceae bacterium]
MIKNLIICFICFSCYQAIAQEEIEQQRTVSLKGQIINIKSKSGLSGAHLFNLNTVNGAVANKQGYFDFPAQVNDTIYISYLGFQSIKLKITNDLLRGNELLIELHEKREQIDEVVVRSHKLVGVLEIDAKNIPIDKYARIHISGLAQTYEVGAPKTRYTSPIAALFNPVDAIYNMFGKKPNRLKKLKKLRDQDNLRSMMEGKFNRELMMEYLDLNAQELATLLNECNYSDYFIRSASDLQLTEAILLCYENHKAIKKGSTIKKREKE